MTILNFPRWRRRHLPYCGALPGLQWAAQEATKAGQRVIASRMTFPLLLPMQMNGLIRTPRALPLSQPQIACSVCPVRTKGKPSQIATPTPMQAPATTMLLPTPMLVWVRCQAGKNPCHRPVALVESPLPSRTVAREAGYPRTCPPPWRAAAVHPAGHEFDRPVGWAASGLLRGSGSSRMASRARLRIRGAATAIEVVSMGRAAHGPPGLQGWGRPSSMLTIRSPIALM
mmetsp:Transcript_64224/g.166845  ORF Transcript_64224/g.166845 Transcript_64224/m.166845 type:complete len:229 (+) Transcript_64224:29-715(+)